MAKKIVTIDSIYGGISPSSVLGPEGFYLSGYAIDPFFPSVAVTNYRKYDKLLRPGQPYTKFTGTEITALLKHIVLPHTRINNLWFLYITEAKIHLSNNVFTMQTADDANTPNTFPRSVPDCGRGAKFYDPGGTSTDTDYVFYKNGTQIGTYGPTGVAASLDFQDNWKTGLYNGVSPMYWHLWDNYLYIGNGTAGAGTIDALKGNTSSSWATTPATGEYESTVLRLPKGFIITDIDSWGSKLLISGSQTNTAVEDTSKRGIAGVFVWDTLSPFWDKFIPYPDAEVTAIQKVNGIPYVFSGGVDTRLSILYPDAGTYQDVAFLPNIKPPYEGSTDAFGEWLVWAPTGTKEIIQDPELSEVDTRAGIFAYGRLHPTFSKGVHCIARAPIVAADDGATAQVSGVAFIEQQTSLTYPRVVFGFEDGAGTPTYGAARGAAAAFRSVYRSPKITYRTDDGQVKPFKINWIRYQFAQAVSSSTSTIAPKLHLDSLSSSETLAVINNTNYAAATVVRQFPESKFTTDAVLELLWGSTNTAALEIILPITMEIESLDD